MDFRVITALPANRVYSMAYGTNLIRTINLALVSGGGTELVSERRAARRRQAGYWQSTARQSALKPQITQTAPPSATRFYLTASTKNQVSNVYNGDTRLHRTAWRGVSSRQNSLFILYDNKQIRATSFSINGAQGCVFCFNRLLRYVNDSKWNMFARCRMCLLIAFTAVILCK